MLLIFQLLSLLPILIGQSIIRCLFLLKFKTFVLNGFNLILQILHHLIILSRCFCILCWETVVVLPYAQRAVSSTNCDRVVCTFSG